MSNISIIVEISKAIKEFYNNTKTIIEYKEAVDRVKKRKDAFPPPKEAQKLLNSNARLERKLNSITHSGIPDPAVPNPSIEKLVNPSSRPQALQKFKETLKIRTDHQNAIIKRISELENLVGEADAKSQAARYISNSWGNMIDAPIPDIGTVGRATYLKYYLLFQKMASSLSSVTRAARKAKKRIENDLKDYRKGTDILRANMKTFSIF